MGCAVGSGQRHRAPRVRRRPGPAGRAASVRARSRPDTRAMSVRNARVAVLSRLPRHARRAWRAASRWIRSDHDAWIGHAMSMRRRVGRGVGRVGAHVGRRQDRHRRGGPLPAPRRPGERQQALRRRCTSSRTSTSPCTAGEVVVVIGPSGSGKSTLCRTINRLETYESGTITLDGHRPARGGQGARPAALRRRHGLPVVQPVRAQDGAGERHARPDQGPRQEEGRGRQARARAARARRASTTRPTSTRPSCPAASSSAWRSPGRWRWTPR